MIASFRPREADAHEAARLSRNAILSRLPWQEATYQLTPTECSFTAIDARPRSDPDMRRGPRHARIRTDDGGRAFSSQNPRRPGATRRSRHLRRGPARRAAGDGCAERRRATSCPACKQRTITALEAAGDWQSKLPCPAGGRCRNRSDRRLLAGCRDRRGARRRQLQLRRPGHDGLHRRGTGRSCHWRGRRRTTGRKVTTV